MEKMVFFFKKWRWITKTYIRCYGNGFRCFKRKCIKKANEYSGETFAKKVLEVYKQAILIKEYTYTVVSIFPIKNNKNEVSFTYDEKWKCCNIRIIR